MENYEEKEISLGGLMVYVFKAWKKILVFMLAFAIIFGGGAYLKDYARYSSIVKSDSPCEAIISSLKAEDRVATEDVYQKSVDYNKLLEQKAVLLGEETDIENIYKTILTYYLNINSEADSQAIVADLTNAYILDMNNNEWKIKLVDSLNDKVEIEDLNRMVNVSVNNNTVTITIKSSNEIDLAIISNSIKSELARYNIELSGKIAPHRLNLINDITELITNDIKDSKIAELDQNLASLLEEINALKSALNDDQKAIVDQLLSISTISAPSVSKKLIVLGAILGAFVVCAWYGFAYLLTNKLRYDDNFKAILGINELGLAESASQSKNKLDKLLSSLEKGKIKTLSREEQVKLICSNIKTISKELEGEKIYIDVLDGSLETLANDIINSLSSEGLNLEAVSSLMKNIETLDAMGANDVVCLVGKANVTDYKQIEGEISACNIHKKKLVGIVVEL